MVHSSSVARDFFYSKHFMSRDGGRIGALDPGDGSAQVLHEGAAAANSEAGVGFTESRASNDINNQLRAADFGSSGAEISKFFQAERCPQAAPLVVS